MRDGYVNRIKTKVEIYSSKKSVNLFDGSYRSVFRGRSMNFEELREYYPGDNVKDIDWKASSRTNKILVRDYIAEKKHNVMLVFDTGRKMGADTPKGENKKELALLAGGTIGYLAAKNADQVGALFNNNGMIHYEPFRLGMNNLEYTLMSYDKGDNLGNNCDINKSLNFLLYNINRSMIIFLITDRKGIAAINPSTLDALKLKNDLLVLNIEDATLTGGLSYEMDSSTYFPDFLKRNKKLKNIEEDIKISMERANEQKLNEHGIASENVASDVDMVETILKLLREHKNAFAR